ncbi:hypothetical protein BRD00_00830 [Halobacteriales archaeon QS_8_69_26]|nr:MAG: hypothetical protein BRD00_00830 [Halobacteriales archaeon QS_8_69_26]
MERSTVLAVAVLVALPVVVGVGGQAGTAVADPPDDARVTVTDVAVSPGTPVTGEPVTMAVTLRNSAGSPSPAAVEWVAVREGDRTLVNATDPGTLSGGETLTIPLTARFDSAGEHELTVVAVATDENGNRTRVERPLSVVVERAPPQVELGVPPSAVGEPTRVAVTVANPTTEPVRNLALSVDGDGFDPVANRATVPDLAAGETTTVNVTLRPTAAGEGSVRADLSYTTAAGVRANTSLSRTVSVAPADRDVGVRVEPVSEDEAEPAIGGVEGVLGGGQTTEEDEGPRRPTTVEVTVTNFGNAPARAVVVRPVAGDRTLPRQAVPGPVAPGESASVTVDLSSVDRAGEVRFSVEYRMAGDEGSVEAAYDYRPATGSVALTGVSMRFGEDGALHVEGNAGNVGDAEVTGVVVAVGNATGVEPTYPRRNYFVGTVEGSEFAPFELTADVDAPNATVVPLVVTYTVDGVQQTRRIRIPYDDSLTPPDEGGGGPVDSGLLLGVLVGVALVGIPLGGWAAVRRIRDGGERQRVRADADRDGGD